MRHIGLIALGVALCASAAWAQGAAADEKKIIANERMINDSFTKKNTKMFHMMVEPKGVGVDGGGTTMAPTRTRCCADDDHGLRR